MMMMSRTQPLGEGRPGLCVAKGGLRVVGGGDAAGKGGSGARARAGHPGGAGCFLSRPRARGGGGGWRKAGPAPPPGIDDSAAGHGHLGQGQRRGRRSADATDGFGGACRRRAPVFRAVSEAKRDRPELRCSRSPCRPPFRILQRRRGPPRRRLFTRLRLGRARGHVRTCQLAVTALLPALPLRNVGLRAFQRNFRPKKKARESRRGRCGLPVLFINRLCEVLLPDGVKAKRGGEGP
nr:uncharacterized protein LOC106847054 isoform X2 [Equus asinus]